MSSVACFWCGATASSPWAATVERWTQPWNPPRPGVDLLDAEWLCRECTAIHDALSRRLIMLLCAAAVRLGFLPALVVCGYGTPAHRVWLDTVRRGREGIVDLADPGILANARAYDDLTTISPERAVLVRDGRRWKVEDRTAAAAR
jgi:hypothetical protein